MADVGAAVRRILLDDAGVSALASTRVYRLELPQDPTYPAVTVQQITGVRPSEMGSDPGNVESRVQVDYWTKPGGGVRALANAGRTALQRFSGTATGTTIDDVYVESEMELKEEGVKVLRVSHDYRIWWRD